MKRKALFILAGLFSVLLLMNFGYASPDAAQAAEETAKTGIESGSWLSIMPPLVAIGIALVFRQVLFALFLGIWCGAFLAGDLSFGGLFSSFFTALDGYIVPATADESHMSIIYHSYWWDGRYYHR